MVTYHRVELNIHEWDLDGNDGQFEALIILLYVRPFQAVALPHFFCHKLQILRHPT